MFYRINKKRNFTILANNIFFEDNMSNSAIGLYARLMSLPDSWKVSFKGLCSLSSDGDRKVSNAIHELERYGYLHKSQLKENGKIVGYNWDVYDIPEIKYRDKSLGFPKELHYDG